MLQHQGGGSIAGTGCTLKRHWHSGFHVRAPQGLSRRRLCPLQVSKGREAHGTSRRLARTALYCTTVLWSTYAPALRYIYVTNETITPSQLTAFRAVVSAAALLITALVVRLTVSARVIGPTRDSVSGSTIQTLVSRQSLLISGVELGVWNFLGTSFQALGLEQTTATKAAFLTQLVTALTPLVAYLAGDIVGGSSWVACCLALVGSTLVAVDDVNPDSSTLSILGLGWGEVWILLSTIFYAVATVRLSRLSPRHRALDLASIKLCTFASMALVWWWTSESTHLPMATHLGQVSVGASGQQLSWVMLGILIYSALGPGALASYLQTKGQAQVPPTEAQVIFSLTPVWAAMFAGFFLSGEQMGAMGWLGGAMIVGASVLASGGLPLEIGGQGRVDSREVVPDSKGD